MKWYPIFIMFNYVDDGDDLACLSHNAIDLYRFQ